MATPKQTTDGASGGEGKTPKGSTTAEEGSDEQAGMHASTDEVPVSEEFQKATHALVSKAKKPHIMHLRNSINMREDKMRAEEKPEGKDIPETMTDAAMPSQY